ncbi:unnamed protein product [Cuscuta europaea]|uniref:Uncharacterized protein n=1 Tax=Cuscuta europaea TaxID=41803 RepID=A0A9P0YXY6_CUSEU|nr:unnamed protein product [Cuscuta europaea]
MASLSSLAFSGPRPLRHQPNPIHDVRLPFTLRSSTDLNFSAKANSGQQPTPPPSETEEKKSFAVATGELFIGIASRILKPRVGGSAGIEGHGMSMFKDDQEKESYLWKRRKEEIAKVVEDPVHPEVLWEQTVKDVEAEQQWKPVTSPGFSFSAAGLLFPYHLGVAQCLIEKGYIRVHCFWGCLCSQSAFCCQIHRSTHNDHWSIARCCRPTSLKSTHTTTTKC